MLYLAGNMSAPEEFYDSTLYLIRAENAVSSGQDARTTRVL
jgi:hypothetical protein